MQSMKGEVVLNMRAKRAWDMYRSDDIISKINPHMLASANYIQGDGTPGSIRHLKLGPAVISYVKESVEKIENVEDGRFVTYSVVDGDLKKMYDPYIVTFSFIPIDGEENKCKVEWKADFAPLTSTTPPPERARDAALGFVKSFDDYQLNN